MARRFATSIDLTGFSLLGALLNPVSSDPAGLGTQDAGRVWFNTTTNKLMVWNGTAAIDFLARANHTGTQLASTISDLAATVKAYRLDEFAVPTVDVSLGGKKITNQADPTGPQDSATKNYVDTQLSGLSSGLVIKGSVRVATSTNVSTSAPGASIDGITMVAGDTILLMGQTTASQNGPWVWNGAAAALTRPSNWANGATATPGAFWDVREGTNADLFALFTTDTAVTIGTTSATFIIRGNTGSSYTAGNGITLPGNAITVNPASGGGIAVAAGGVTGPSRASRVAPSRRPPAASSRSPGRTSPSTTPSTTAVSRSSSARAPAPRPATPPGSSSSATRCAPTRTTSSSRSRSRPPRTPGSCGSSADVAPVRAVNPAARRAYSRAGGSDQGLRRRGRRSVAAARCRPHSDRSAEPVR